MTTTLTFRLAAEQRKKLRHKSHLLGKSESQFLREILNRALDERPMSDTLVRLKGALSLKDKKKDGWQQAMRKRNWRS